MMRFHEESINDMKSISGGSIEEVENFKYLGDWMKCCQHDVKARKAQTWMACHKLKKYLEVINEQRNKNQVISGDSRVSAAL